MLHELAILVRKLAKALPQRIAPRFEQVRAIDSVLRQQVDRHIAQLRTDTAPAAGGSDTPGGGR